MPKCMLAVLYLSSYLSMMVYEADQTKFSLPHFTASGKYQLGHGIAVQFVSLLLHGSINKLDIFTMTEDYASAEITLLNFCIKRLMR